MTLDWLLWVMLVVQIITLVFVLLVHDGVKFLWKKLSVMATHMDLLVKQVSTTQSNLRTRRKSDGVEPIIDRPKAAQHYEGSGVRRVARGGKETEAGGESTPARIGQVKRRSYGGTSSNPPGS